MSNLAEKVTLYSINEECFIYNSAGDAMEQMEADGNLDIDSIYHSCEFGKKEMEKYFSAADIVDSVVGKADIEQETFNYDRSVSELEGLLKPWIKKHFSAHYKCVGRITEHAVTAEDIQNGVTNDHRN